MKKLTIKIISIMLALLLVGSLFVGCTNKGKDQESDTTTVEDDKDKGEKEEDEDKDKEDDGPVEPVKVTYWAATTPESPELAPEVLDCYKKVEEKTGVQIEWMHIPKGQETEQFNLMIASDKLPDVIFYKWLKNYGPDKAFDDEIIIPLDDIISQYSPGLKKLLDEDKELAKMLKSDSGHYYCYPYLRGEDLRDLVISGLYTRQDWLDDLGLEPPETIDEWYDVLTAYKNQKGAKIPLGLKTGQLGFFTAAWGFNGHNCAVVDGKVYYPPIEEEYKECLRVLRKWIEEGLLVLDTEGLDKHITAGEVGAWQANPGSYVEKTKEVDPKFEIVALKNPVLNKGDDPYIFPRWRYTERGAAITTHCAEEKYEAIGRWLDFTYTEEGYIFDNFGEEGVHYNLVDGKIMPTDMMYNPPEGKTIREMESEYFRPRNAPGPYRTGDRHLYLHEDALKKDPKNEYELEADKTWRVGDSSRNWPMVTFTSEEQEKFNDFEHWDYVWEMYQKFLSGEESLDNFDKYIEEVKRLRIEDLLDIYQAALDRYNAR